MLFILYSRNLQRANIAVLRLSQYNMHVSSDLSLSTPLDSPQLLKRYGIDSEYNMHKCHLDMKPFPFIEEKKMGD